jgi:hypothetical protein
MALLICRCACLPHGLFNLLLALGAEVLFEAGPVNKQIPATARSSGTRGAAFGRVEPRGSTVIERWPVAPLWLNRAGCCKPMSAS